MNAENAGHRLKKIFWTPGEWGALAAAVEQLTHENRVLSKLAALERAQERELRPERRRTINAWSVVSGKLDPLLETARAERKTREQHAATVRPAPVKTAEQLRQEKLKAWMATTAELFAPLLAEMFKQPAVAAEVHKAVAAIAPTGFAREALNTFAASFSAQGPSAPAATVVRPKILVAGLLPAQANEVCADLNDLVEFRFWATDESKEKLKALARNCEIAVGVTNFLSHSADASLKSLAPKYVRHTGGITRLKETLREVVVEAGPPPGQFAH